MEELLDDLYYDGPQEFEPIRLRHLTDLFRLRGGLFFTPTANLPEEWIGRGSIDVEIPIAFPTTFDAEQNRCCWCPRMWVDLIQRATRRIRWLPMTPATVVLIRYDYTTYSQQNLFGGIKALLDSLKYSSSGRADGRNVYYFGAIRDDNRDDLRELRIEQERVSTPAEARSRIIVTPAH